MFSSLPTCLFIQYLVRLKILIFKVGKLTQRDYPWQPDDLLRDPSRTESLWRGGAARHEKNSALASIPKTISIGNVRITNRRYTVRVHCAAKNRGTIFTCPGREKPFSDRGYLPLREIVFLVDILHKSYCSSFWIVRIIMKFKGSVWHVWSDTIHIRENLCTCPYSSGEIFWLTVQPLANSLFDL